MSETTPKAGSRPSTRPVTWPQSTSGDTAETTVSRAVSATPADGAAAPDARAAGAKTTAPATKTAPAGSTTAPAAKPRPSGAGRTSTATVATTGNGTSTGEPLNEAVTPAVVERRARRTRRARLRVSRIDPWSVMKTALLFGIAGGIMFVVATYFVMTVIESTGLWDAVNKAYADVLAAPGDPNAFDISTYINTRRATGLAALIGAIDVVIFTALATVFSFLYNLSATMLGGLEITLAED